MNCCFVAGLFPALVLIYQLVTWLRSRIRVGDYHKKHVLVTGCDTGFGNLLAKRLDVLGFRVFAACLTSQAAEKLQEETSSRVTTLVLDVSDEKSISAARDFVAARLPEGQGLWGVVNNAGIVGPVSPSEWVSRDGYQTCLAVNLLGLIDVTRTFLPLVRRARGRVVNTASMSGRIAFGPSPYCVSKYGVEAFSDCLRREVYRQGVQVCIIEPGGFKTDLLRQDSLFKTFKMSYDATPADIRQHYPESTVEACNSFADLAFLFRIPGNTIHKIVMDTCAALYRILRVDFLKVPSTEAEWQQISLEFAQRWNLPNCIGAIDGKHVAIRSPGGSTHYNYLKFHSIILLAVVDAKYRFLYFNVGANGRAGDAGVFRDSTLAAALENNTLNIPTPVPLPGRVTPVPYFIVGDDAFPLKPYLLKPFPFRRVIQNLQDAEEEMERRRQRIFDYRLSRARRIVENVFGILAARFGVLQKPMAHSPERATTVTLACIALHNFLRSKVDQEFVPPCFIDREDTESHRLIEGDWRQNPHQLQPLNNAAVNRSSTDARLVREEVKNYVNEEGTVPWQSHIVFG